MTRQHVTTCEHKWTYYNGRSRCDLCGAWAPDLRCCPGLRKNGGGYPTATDLQSRYACAVCGENLLTKVVGGELRIVCVDGHDAIEVGRAVPRDKRDYIRARQEADAMEVLDGLPPELRALVGDGGASV